MRAVHINIVTSVHSPKLIQSRKGQRGIGACSIQLEQYSHCFGGRFHLHYRADARVRPCFSYSHYEGNPAAEMSSG